MYETQSDEWLEGIIRDMPFPRDATRIARIGPEHWALTYRRVDDFVGLSSHIGDGKHMTFWDFDGGAAMDHVEALLRVQARYDLPNVDLFQSSPGHWLAWSPTARPLAEVARIIIETPGIDLVWLGFGLTRDYLTMRTSPKDGHVVEHAITLESAHYPEVSLDEIELVWYESALPPSGR